jgi:hypothetical protein
MAIKDGSEPAGGKTQPKALHVDEFETSLAPSTISRTTSIQLSRGIAKQVSARNSK